MKYWAGKLISSISNSVAYWAIMILLLLTPTGSAASQSGTPPTCDRLVKHLYFDADDKPDAAQLACHFTDNSDDQVLVVYRSSNVHRNPNWRNTIGVEDDIWLFDFQSDDRVNLIIDFHRDGNRYLADVYDDQDNDMSVSYQIVDGEVKITESDFWTVRFIAQHNWLQGSVVNFNLQVLIDGDVEAMFGSNNYRQGLKTDGEVDFFIEVADTDRDGRPDYEYRWHEIPGRQNLVGEGFHLMVNWADDEPLPESAPLWPFLSAARDVGGSHIPKADHYRPPLEVDWKNGTIVAVAEFVTSRAGDSNCFIYGSAPLESGSVVNAGFENPFCYYDLADDEDGKAELIIRNEYWPPGDPRFVNGRYSEAIEWIRYSWDQDNDNKVDFGLGLAGSYPVTSTIVIGNYEIRSLPYHGFPSWVTDRKWDAAVFVDAEERPIASNEGIYAAQVPMPVIEEYLTGFSDEQHDIDLASLAVLGTRIEYAADLDANPSLYFSPVDRRLHIDGISDGYLSISQHQAVTYHDTNQDGYADHWRYYENDEVIRDLHIATDHIIYSDAAQQTADLRRIEIPVSSFETTPPRNHEEWLALGRQLETHQRDGTLGDLAGMAAQFEGPGLSVEGATLREYRPTGDGFRFSLDLQPGFRLDYDPALDDLGEALSGPGSYVISYGGGSYAVVERTPPSPYVADLALTSDSGSIQKHEWQTIQATIGNAGTADQRDLLVCAALEGPTGAPVVLTDTLALLPGEGEAMVMLPWAPSESGQWKVRLMTGCNVRASKSGSGSVLYSGLVEVGPVSAPRWTWFLTLGDRVSAGVVLFLAGVALMAGLVAVFWYQCWPVTARKADQ